MFDYFKRTQLTYHGRDLKRLHDHEQLGWSDFGDRVNIRIVLFILAVAVAEFLWRTT